MYAVGSTIGLVANCGHEISSTIPVYEVYTLPPATERINLAGRDLTESLRVLIERNGFDSEDFVKMRTWFAFPPSEKCCYI